jgi:hypothetical protein
MKRVRREGVDITDVPLDFATDVAGLEIELTHRLTTISGGVSDHRGDVALDATVIVFADDPAKWGPHSRFIESARPDQQGRFTIEGCRPAGIWRLPWDTWSLATNGIRICSRHGARVQRPSRSRRGRRTPST